LSHKVLKRGFKELLENLVVTSSKRLFSRWLRELECKAVVVILSRVVITRGSQVNEPAKVILDWRQGVVSDVFSCRLYVHPREFRPHGDSISIGDEPGGKVGFKIVGVCRFENHN